MPHTDDDDDDDDEYYLKEKDARAIREQGNETKRTSTPLKRNYGLFFTIKPADYAGFDAYAAVVLTTGTWRGMLTVRVEIQSLEVKEGKKFKKSDLEGRYARGLRRTINEAAGAANQGPPQQGQPPPGYVPRRQTIPVLRNRIEPSGNNGDVSVQWSDNEEEGDAVRVVPTALFGVGGGQRKKLEKDIKRLQQDRAKLERQKVAAKRGSARREALERQIADKAEDIDALQSALDALPAKGVLFEDHDVLDVLDTGGAFRTASRCRRGRVAYELLVQGDRDDEWWTARDDAEEEALFDAYDALSR